METVRPSRYIALGDSLSIDRYPAIDVEARYPGRAFSSQLGAPALLYRNDDRLWPEFRGRDLVTLCEGVVFRHGRVRGGTDDFTADGATTRDLPGQLRGITRSDEPTLVTITAGGNDLLGEIGFRGLPAEDGDPGPAIFERLRRAMLRVLELRPNGTVLVGTVYDPSDGTNRLPGWGGNLDAAARWLRDYNDAIRTLPRSDRRIRLADIHTHFLGHGLTAPERERWYLEELIIEPNARGASEIRRLWLEALGFQGPGVVSGLGRW